MDIPGPFRDKIISFLVADMIQCIVKVNVKECLSATKKALKVLAVKKFFSVFSDMYSKRLD